MERKRTGSSNWKAKQSWKEDIKMVEKCPHSGKASGCDPPKRAAMFLWKAKLSKFSSKAAKYTKVRNVENGNSAHMMGKAKVCAPKRSALGMLPNFHNNAANTTKDMDDGVMLHMANDIPRVDHRRNVDLDRVLPGVGDKVRERSMMMAGHCVTESLTLVTSKLAQWEPIQGTPRRRKRRTASNNTAELLMNERKVRRAAILKTRRTGVTNPSTETTLDQKHRVAVVNSPQLASVQAPPQVAPSTVPEQPAEPVMDIDAGDSDMPQLCSEYVKDIYAHLMDLEVQQSVRPGYLKGCDITAQMRSLLIGWLILIRSRFHLMQETLFLTVAILDRFLQVQPVSRKLLQLVGVTAMLLAAKYEEKAWGTDTPRIQDFANITDNTFTPAQIRDMEQVMLTSLDFELGRPVPSHFLRRASKAANLTMKTLALSNYLMELTLLDYDMVHYRPSEIAAASLCLSQLLDGLPWTPAERHYTTYDETHLVPIMQHIAKNVVFVNEGRTEFQVVKSKYSGTMLMSVALLPELHSPVLDMLAAPLLAC